MAWNRNYHQEQETNDNVLGWKKHGEFFDIYYKLKSEYNQLYSLSILDYKHCKESIAKLFEFLEHIKGQIQKKVTLEDLRKDKNKLLSTYASKDYKKLLKDLEDFSSSIMSHCVELELEPKPEEKKEDAIESEPNSRIRNAMRAYDLLFDDL